MSKKWFGAYRCSECRGFHGYNEWLLNNATCKHCGSRRELSHVSVQYHLTRKAVWWKKLLGLDKDEYRMELKE